MLLLQSHKRMSDEAVEFGSRKVTKKRLRDESIVGVRNVVVIG